MSAKRQKPQRRERTVDAADDAKRNNPQNIAMSLFGVAGLHFLRKKLHNVRISEVKMFPSHPCITSESATS